MLAGAPVRSNVHLTAARAGPYALLDELGRGGMGVVYRARHETSGALAAVKTLHQLDARTLDALRREVAALSRLHHPNIVRILDADLDTEPAWYAMEFVEGQTLDTFAQGAPTTGAETVSQAGLAQTVADAAVAGQTTVVPDTAPATDTSGFGVAPASEAVTAIGARVANPTSHTAVLRVLLQVCRALEYLHGEGLVHCDLKPDNVMVTADGLAVVMDFGVAADTGRRVDGTDLPRAAFAAGTANYFAPERIRDEPFDARSDLYALGCMLFEAVCGEPPFHGGPVHSILIRHMGLAPDPLARRAPNCPPALCELVDSLLAKDPRDRPGSAAVVTRILERELGTLPRLDLPATRPFLFSAPLVGRTQAYSCLQTAFDDAASGQRRCVVLTGPAGCGKTRTVQELLRRTRRVQREALAGQPSGVRPEPLSALRGPLEQIALWARAHGTEEDVFGTHSALAPASPRMAATLGQPTDGDAFHTERIGRDVERALTRYAAASRQTVVLVLDDIDTADAMSLSCLREIMGRAGTCHVIAVATARLDPPREEIRALLAAPGVQEIKLAALDDDSIHDILAHMLGTRSAVPRGLQTWLRHRTAGNPFYLATYLEHAVAEGWLHRTRRGYWAWTAPGGTTLQSDPGPDEIRTLLEARVQRLSTGAQALCCAAALLGPRVERAALATLMGETVDMDQRLAELAAAGFLEDTDGSVRVRGSRDLREVLTRALGPAARELHRTITTRNLTGGDNLRRAWHLECAGDTVPARDAYTVCAHAALKAGAVEDAAYALHRAICLHEPGAARATLEALLVEAVLLPQNRADDALEALARLEPAWEALPPLRGHGLRLRARALFMAGRSDEALACIDAALGLARSTANTSEEAASNRIAMTIHAEAGRWGTARELGHRAHTLLQDAGRQRDATEVLMSLGNIARGAGDLESARSIFHRATAQARQVGLELVQLECRLNVATLDVMTGAADRAEPELAACAARWEELGHLGRAVAALNVLAVSLGRQHRFQEAVAVFEQALPLSSTAAPRHVQVLHNFANMLRRQGNLEAAKRRFDEVLSLREALGAGRGTILTLGALAEVCARMGSDDQVRSLRDRAVALARTVGNEQLATGAMLAAAQSAWLNRDAERAAALLASIQTQDADTELQRGHAVLTAALLAWRGDQSGARAALDVAESHSAPDVAAAFAAMRARLSLADPAQQAPPPVDDGEKLPAGLSAYVASVNALLCAAAGEDPGPWLAHAQSVGGCDVLCRVSVETARHSLATPQAPPWLPGVT